MSATASASAAAPTPRTLSRVLVLRRIRSSFPRTVPPHGRGADCVPRVGAREKRWRLRTDPRRRRDAGRPDPRDPPAPDRHRCRLPVAQPRHADAVWRREPAGEKMPRGSSTATSNQRSTTPAAASSRAAAGRAGRQRCSLEPCGSLDVPADLNVLYVREGSDRASAGAGARRRRPGPRAAAVDGKRRHEP